jgi:hypothetical protein
VDKIGYPQFKEERFLNFLKTAQACPTIAEVTEVFVSKTADTGQYVIVLHGPDADAAPANGVTSNDKDTCTLWLNGNQVRAITNY